MTIALQLDETGVSALQTQAAELGVTPEQLATEIVRRHVLARATPKAIGPDDPLFKAALAASMKDNEELLRRLAK